VTNCTNARLAAVATAAATTTPTSSSSGITTLTLAGTGTAGTGVLSLETTEVFPLQTVMYYVAPSDNNASTLSLFRHVFSGNSNTGEKQELIEGVENMQILYGVDTTTAADGEVDAYQVASDVDTWERVLSVRLSLLMRPINPLGQGLSSAASAVVNDTTVTFPNARFDRRVFTTTLMLRNKLQFKAAS